MARVISNINQRKYGINFLIKSPPVLAAAQVQSTIGLTVHLPWGPEGVNLYAHGGAIEDAHLPYEFDANNEYPSAKAFLAPLPGPIYINNLRAADAVAATTNLLGASETVQATVTCKHRTVQGNKIRIIVEEGSLATYRHVTVEIGNRYSVKYEDVFQGTSVFDPGDPFVTFAMTGSPTEPPSAVTVTLSGGSDGTLTSAEWVGTELAGTGGVRNFLANDVFISNGILVACEVPDAVVDTYNTVADSVAKARNAYSVCSAPSGQTVTQIRADATALDSPNSWYHGVKVRLPNEFDPDLTETTMDFGPFAAAALASLPPFEGPGEANGAEFFKAITGVVLTATDDDLQTCLEAGASVPRMTRRGCRVYGSRNTSSDDAQKFISTIRVRNYVATGLNEIFADATDITLPIDVTARKITGKPRRFFMAAKTFMESLLNPPEGAGDAYFDGYTLDAFQSTPEQIASGTWIVGVSIKTFAHAESIVFNITAGPTVVA